MVWLLGGADGLNIDGAAAKTPRPTATIDVGTGWGAYGGDPGGHRYSQAQQITPDNVHRLALAWQYRTGDMTARAAHMESAATEGTPILVGDALILCTPFNEVIALDAGTGEERWRFDPQIDLGQDPANQFTCRGVAHWRDADAAGACANRIFTGTNDARLIAIDAATAQRCAGFGDEGEVRIDPGMPLLWPGEFQITSPPVTVGDTVVVGSAIGDNARVVAPAGSVRAFDARTGAPRWDWDPIPRSEDNPAAPTWEGEHPPQEGHANAWAPMAADERRGLVFVPTSSPSPDFFGGLRPGNNRHANSVVALDGLTGNLRWSFQTVHHDIWDYDVPAQPGLYSVWQDGQLHDVVAQVTKTGFVFVLDRDTGEPFLPVEERPVPQAAVPGEWLSPTQPFPVATPPLVP
ncbi:MAG: PQQ-binding-like beta-propeller repeat protein, partial [Gammaproteobacteria bacterium]|nr:PQQ-binding-like beta-propeller repeat protein [Gammaproteobacteria bacterium]